MYKPLRKLEQERIEPVHVAEQWVRRNWAAIVLAGSFGMLLVMAAAISSVLAARANQAERLAQSKARRAEQARVAEVQGDRRLRNGEPGRWRPRESRGGREAAQWRTKLGE